jgi:hypothetical protein
MNPTRYDLPELNIVQHVSNNPSLLLYARFSGAQGEGHDCMEAGERAMQEQLPRMRG